ncbi:transcriptional regulator [Actinoallomurus soli]|uniref:transcriptional regulator n=1 Tax=Actinoallomurus soli TaxID=2952535 RepID=UPI0020935203|nr:transcriptional regulator [Actinoallomurus soli]MCO5967451.1 transcriptional regulator [Actinoallomurus soli]
MAAADPRIGARLRAERKARRMTVQALAEAFRDNATERDRKRLPKLRDLCRTIRGHEAGEHPPGPRYRMFYAAVFGMSEEELFGDGRDVQEFLPWTFKADVDSGLTPDDEERLGLAMRRPARVDAGVIEALSMVLSGQRRLEDAIGPVPLLAPVTAQVRSVTAMLRETSGPYRDELAVIAADWTTFAGWLRAAVRQDAPALALFDRGEELADDVDYGTGAALATSFRGYVARKQGRPRAVVRAASAALATRGVHPSQRAFDTLQAAQGHAMLGDREDVRRLLDRAVDLAEGAGEPPRSVYWYTEGFFRLNIGVALAGIGEYRDAVDIITSGLDGIPVDQRAAEWLHEYEEALADAKVRA